MFDESRYQRQEKRALSELVDVIRQRGEEPLAGGKVWFLGAPQRPDALVNGGFRLSKSGKVTGARALACSDLPGMIVEAFAYRDRLEWLKSECPMVAQRGEAERARWSAASRQAAQAPARTEVTIVGSDGFPADWARFGDK